MKPLTGRWREHWPEYLMEAWGLGLFLVNACLAGAVLEYPASFLHQAILNDLARRSLFGAAMGLTIVLFVYCPWGKRSGAHINPAITLTFLRLGKIALADAFFYIVAQFADEEKAFSAYVAIMNQRIYRRDFS